MRFRSRKNNSVIVQSLNRVNQRGAIATFSYIVSDLDSVVRPQTDKESIECGVMKRTKSQAVSNNWLTLGGRIRNDMSRVK